VGIFIKEYGRTTYKNIDAVDGDLERVMELYTQVLQIPQQNITILKDASYDEIEKLWQKLKDIYSNASHPTGQKTLILAWVAGHGEMGGSAHTMLVTNS